VPYSVFSRTFREAGPRPAFHNQVTARTATAIVIRSGVEHLLDVGLLYVECVGNAGLYFPDGKIAHYHQGESGEEQGQDYLCDPPVVEVHG
jgi:hypothetical protein